MVFNKLKNKILDSSDSYAYYKKQYEQHEKILDSYHKLFNALYLNFELTPTPFLDYIPWDDDLDTAMMRPDYDVFCEVIDEEIVNNNLTNVTATLKEETHKVGPVQRWIQIHYKHPDYDEKKFSFVGLDVFPFDYLKDYHGQDIQDHYQKTRIQYYQDRIDGLSYEDAMKNCYDSLNLSMEPQDYYISGVEGTRGPVNTYKLVMMETDKLFPLKQMRFGENEFPVPNDYKDYLIAQYGKSYLKIPKVIRDHGRLDRIRGIDNINEMLGEAVEIFKESNKNFK